MNSALALSVRTERAPPVWSFIPVDPQPGQIVEKRGLGPRQHPGAVEILDTQNELSTAEARCQPGQQGRSGISGV
jgi:hypothetical protein